MNIPNAECLLRIWEEHAGVHPIRGALALLEAAASDLDGMSWAHVAVGERDAHLLELHETLFGPRLETTIRCPQCNERLESTFATRDLGRWRKTRRAPQGLKLSAGDWRIDYRLPNSEDLLQVSAIDDADAARSELLRRCVINVESAGKHQGPEPLPPSMANRLTEDMADHDPLADIRIQLNCPACQHAWTAGFDIVSYLWGELDDWAQRTLADVHALAREYGWNEREILALSPTRRRHYIQMVHA